MEIFHENGIKNGILSLGGNVQALGTKPDGSLWRVGLQNPADERALFATLELADKAVITSGAYERNFERTASSITTSSIHAQAILRKAGSAR